VQITQEAPEPAADLDRIGLAEARRRARQARHQEEARSFVDDLRRRDAARDQPEEEGLLVALPTQLAAVDLQDELAAVGGAKSVVGVHFPAIERRDADDVEVGEKLPRSFEVH
jgi:hypothetical protein